MHYLSPSHDGSVFVLQNVFEWKATHLYSFQARNAISIADKQQQQLWESCYDVI